MNKTKLVVPPGIRYISDWKDYTLEKFQFPHILNKTLTGCGFTSDCITNNLNIILCSPRKILLENKEDQNQGKVLYVRNEVEKSIDFEKDFAITSQRARSGYSKLPQFTEEEVKARIMKLKDSVKGYWNSCRPSPFSPGKPCKILVTYDSFRHVKEALGNDIKEFYIVIDEFQSIFCDAKFKSDTELEFVDQLKSLQRVCLVSATPMLEKYLDMLDEFKDLPYYELDWGEAEVGRIIKPHLDIKYCGKRNTIQSNIKRVIQSYLNGEFDSYRYRDNNGNLQEIQSREAVIYVNSVKDICRAIKSCNLTIDQCNVLVSRTKENEKLVRQAFNGKARDGIEYIGHVPKCGAPHKMFTFCTRTVYLGADFYSTCARSFIFSNANIDSLSVDISMDLPQILGRQRLNENPWKNSAELYVTLKIGEKSFEEFSNYLHKKIDSTNKLLEVYDEISTDDKKYLIADKYQKDARNSNYKDDYVAVNTHQGLTKLPVFNNLMMVAEIRTFEIQEVDYADRFTVFSNLENYDLNSLSPRVEFTLNKFNSISIWTDRMKFLCNQKSKLTGEEFSAVLNLVPGEFKDYLTVFDIGKIGSCKYQRATLEKEFNRLVGIQNNEDSVTSAVLNFFKVGEKYTKSYIKSELSRIYEECNYELTAKATDLEQWFVISPKKITNTSTGKRDHGYEIISKKL